MTPRLSRKPSLFLAAFALSLFAPLGVAAQATQPLEDASMGVRMQVPKAWLVEQKSNGPMASCDPNMTRIVVCYLSLSMTKAAAGQTAFTDADRDKFKKWSASGGGGPVVEARDVKLSGFPAFETVTKSGRDTVYRAFVLMDSPPRVIDVTFYGDGKGDWYGRYKLAVDKAMGTITAWK